MTLEGISDKLLIVVCGAFEGGWEFLKDAFELALNDCSPPDFLGRNSLGVSDVLSRQGILVIIAEVSDKTHQEVTFLSA